jgi:plastocyanin
VASSRRALLGILAAVALLAVPAADATPARAGSPCYHGVDAPPPAAGAATDVRALPCAFDPVLTVIPAGGTVTFRNGPELAHLVTGANQAWGDRDRELGPGQTVAYTFTEPGIYPYACAFHPGMSGAIVVGDGGDALRTAMGGSSAIQPGSGTRDAGTPASAGATTAGASRAAGPDPLPLAAGIAAATLLAVGVLLAAMRLAARRRDPAQPEPSPR